MYIGRDVSAGVPWDRQRKSVSGSIPGVRERLKALTPNKKFRITAAMTAAISIPLVILATVITFSLPMLRISQVEVVGAKTLKAQQVADAAGLYGRSLFEVSDQLVADSLSKMPRVRSVSVVRHFPNWIELFIEERTPWAVWQAGNASYLIDDEGVVLETTTNAASSLPVLQYTGTGPVKLGTRVELEPVKLALQLNRLLPETVHARAKRFEVSDAGGLLVITDQGWQARFGDSQDLEFKLATLQSVVETTKAQKIKFTAVDLRFGPRPFIR
jgi:cell division protein FtsQ